MSSTENSDHSVRRRRAPLIASAAAVMLIAGGGGTYFATAGFDGGEDRDSAGSARAESGRKGNPPPRLSVDPDHPAGFAPGEPAPSGVVYRSAGSLPAGPERAAVHLPSGSVGKGEVARLAAALGVSGTPRLSGAAWTIGPGADGSGPLLRVDQKAPGTWTFSAYGSAPKGDNCVKGDSCWKQDAPDAVGTPVSETAAKKAAVPVLQALGQGDARVDARQLRGAVRVVNAEPVVGGLPTYGWTTGVEIGADGQVVGGGGHLKKPVKGEEYPVLSAQEALDRLNQGGTAAGAADCPPAGPGVDAPAKDVPCGPTACATPVPLEGEQKAAQPCDTVTPERKKVSGAVFALSAQSVAGRQALVPSWLFRVDQSGGAGALTVAHTAVEPEFLQKAGTTGPAQPTKPPKAPKPPKKIKPTGPVSDPAVPRPGQRIESYTVEGRTLTVTFWGGVCSDYRATATQSGSAVKVRIVTSAPDPKKVCILLAKQQTETVTLERPLGDRVVLDAESGQAVKRAGSSG
ncbi:hypothetical protein [Streptomyces albipurpureus]|uniref:hypothetical protein n=1 Tax=Streptomyces albipurpureus TaxID=2897419 RepID=UPI0027E56D7C|nr:hypothetical protein [Streptomyces sp. CWNU-1]